MIASWPEGKPPNCFHRPQNRSSIQTLLSSRDGRWRPHVKSAKLVFTMRRFVAHGVRRVKCATPLKLRTAREAGVDDALLAYPVAAAHVAGIVALARAIADAGLDFRDAFDRDEAAAFDDERVVEVVDGGTHVTRDEEDALAEGGR